MKSPRVIIVDDEPIILAGLQNWLARDYEIATFATPQSFLDAVWRSDFDDGIPTCLLLDFDLPGMNGVQLQTILKSLNARMPIIFISGNALQKDIIDAFLGGAVNFILKPFTPEQITLALEKEFIALQDHTDQAIPKSPPAKDLPITKREAQVLILLAKGKSQNEVAQLLGISLRTVKMYRSFLRDKAGLQTLAELGRYYELHQSVVQKIAK